MAKILENNSKRRMIRVSTDDIISLVREYQTLTKNIYNYEDIRKILNSTTLYIPEDI